MFRMEVCHLDIAREFFLLSAVMSLLAKLHMLI